jgi:small subunit ribosomal protein S1
MDFNTSGLDPNEQMEAAAPQDSTEPTNQPITPTNAEAEIAPATTPLEDATPAPVDSNASELAAEPTEPVAEAAPADVESSALEPTVPGTAEEAPTTIEETAPAPSADAPSQPEAAPAADLPYKRGEVVEGTVVSTSPMQVVVDLGKAQGMIPSHELEKMSRAQLDELTVGTTVAVYVVNPSNMLLSVNRALEELDWQKAETYRASQDTYETRVAGYNKGGLIVRFGRLRGFVPQSQMSLDRRNAPPGESVEERWGKMVNEAIVVKVMEVDRGRNRLILSERLANRESREQRKAQLVSQLTVGEVRMGRVVSWEEFGAFVDIGGAEGLVHLTEISWQHITHPEQVLTKGQEVKVEVISVDKDNKRIGLSIKRQLSDPWDDIAIKFRVGQLVQGTVTKLAKFGAFVQLTDFPEIEGLIHISELSDRRVTTPREVVQEGDKLTLRVVKIEVKDRRLGLSLKKVRSAEYLDIDMDWGS